MGTYNMALIAMVSLSVILVAAAEELARFMIDDEEVVRLTVAFIYIDKRLRDIYNKLK